MVRSGIRNEMDMQRELDPDFVESVKLAEASGYKGYKTGKEMLKDLHKAGKNKIIYTSHERDRSLERGISH